MFLLQRKETENLKDRPHCDMLSTMNDEQTNQQDQNAPLEIAAVVEAILFASDSPLGISKITLAAELPTKNVKQAIDDLNDRYQQQGSAFRIEQIAGGYQMLTQPEYNEVLRRLLTARKDTRLSQAAMETLAIIAYRQPILRADIEAIRGVATGEVLRTLLEKQLVKIVGRAEVIGRPMLYGTTKKFLEVFGLGQLDDLPRVEELRSGADAKLPPKTEKAEPELFDDEPDDEEPDDQELEDEEDLEEENL